MKNGELCVQRVWTGWRNDQSGDFQWWDHGALRTHHCREHHQWVPGPRHLPKPWPLLPASPPQRGASRRRIILSPSPERRASRHSQWNQAQWQHIYFVSHHAIPHVVWQPRVGEEIVSGSVPEVQQHGSVEGEAGDKPGAAVGDIVAGVPDRGVDRERKDCGQVR